MDFSTWWPAVAAAFPGVGAWFYTLYKARQDRLDKGDERRLSFEEKQELAFQKERDRVHEENERQFAELRRSNDAKDQIIDKIRRDMFSALNLAHFWYGKCWDMRNEAAQARQVAESASRLAKAEIPVWGRSLDLPNFELDSKANQSERNG